MRSFYVPWLVLIASMHTMIVFKKSETALKHPLFLQSSTFILEVLYATFLVRSGILGETSVHSFTDLGLSGQLLLYLLFFLIEVFLAARVCLKLIPSSEKEASTYSSGILDFYWRLDLMFNGIPSSGTNFIPSIQ